MCCCGIRPRSFGMEEPTFGSIREDLLRRSVSSSLPPSLSTPLSHSLFLSASSATKPAKPSPPFILLIFTAGTFAAARPPNGTRSRRQRDLMFNSGYSRRMPPRRLHPPFLRNRSSHNNRHRQQSRQREGRREWAPREIGERRQWVRLTMLFSALT